MRRRLGLRGRLVLMVVGGLAVLLAMLLAAYNVVLAHRLNHEIDAILGARASAALSRVQLVGDRVEVAQPAGSGAPDSPLWVFAGRRTLLRPDTDPLTDRAASALAGGPRRHAEVDEPDRRLLAVPIENRGRSVGTVVVGISLVSYEHVQNVALAASVLLAGLVLAAVALAARWLISGALRPVARMTAQAAEWSEHDLGRRFAHGTPHDELTQLAATLDDLLDRVAAALRHEQRFSAEVSHELRTPLAGIVAEAQLALRHPQTPDEYRAGFTRVLETADHMHGTLSTLLATGHAELDGQRSTSDALHSASAARRACERVAAERGVQVDVDVPGDLRVGAGGDVVERILAPLVENGCRYARTQVRMAAESRPGAVVYTIEDDGPGVRDDEREEIFEPGRRGAAAGGAANGGQGTGLGLALARRLARRAGGDVHAVPSAEGGRFLAHLPRA
jgi:two-component system, OmpR family, sensor kinase